MLPWTAYSITMADETNNTTGPRPLADLNAEALQHLEDINDELEEAERGLKALEELGLDVTRMRERINFGKKARETILKYYKPEGG